MWIVCHACATKYWLPDELHASARASDAIHFYCPYGHVAHFGKGESAENRMRRERNRAVQENARLADIAHHAEQRAIKAERSQKRLKKRVAAGVCPCCHRTVGQMAQHMKTKHPDYVKENVVPIRNSA